MFERFTPRARRVVELAQVEARLLNHDHVGTEHILLGLACEAEGVAAKALESLGVSLEAVRREVEEMLGSGHSAIEGRIPFNTGAKKALELSLREALTLGHDYIGTEHLLLGLIREGKGPATRVLVRLTDDVARVRVQVIELLSGYGEGPPAVPDPPRCFRCRAGLAETSAYRVVDATDPAGAQPRPVMVVYCRECGTALGALPGDDG